DAGNQAAYSGQLFTPEQLLLYGPLVEQAEGDSDLIAEMLCQSLLVGGKLPGTVVLIEFKNANDLALRQHGHKEQRFRPAGSVFRGHREWAARDVRNGKKGAVMEARSGAGMSAARRRGQRNGNRVGAAGNDCLERLGGAVIEKDPNTADSKNAR